MGALVSGALILAPSPALLPAPLFAPTPKAAKRVAGILHRADQQRPHAQGVPERHAPLRRVVRGARHAELADVQPFHVAAFVKELQGEFSPPTVKQHLAALRMLFDWLVTGHVLDVNPAHAVRGPKYVVKKGKTPVLDRRRGPRAARRIAIRTAPSEAADRGLRDRALIGVMVYTFARVNAVIGMKVKDYFVQGRRGWVRLHEKGGKEHEVPCHHTLEKFLDEYIAAAGIAGDPDGPLFRTTGRKTGQAQPHVAAGRLPDDPAPRGRRRHRDQDRQPHLPRDRHHRVPQEQGHARTRADDRQPRLAADDEALRPAAG